MAALYDTDSGTHPACDFLYDNRIRPVTDNNLALDPHAAYDMAVFTVAVCRLVFVHEIHVDGIVWNLLVKLCMQMHQRFPVFLQSQNPGFCRGKRMHPGDHARAVLIVICLVEGLADQRICDQGRFPDNFIWQQSGLVQFIHNLFRVLCNLCETRIPI